ncbi:hypothetical protein ACJMK2_017830 [Sinanodonta woodiana]|uniref:Uncharacterized protein n=1 Tax=Sinanodonta woodiana TaxID=1069815 RepID=A0ABD3UE88_SINWO
MNLNGIMSFFLCMVEVVFIRLASPNQAANTYVLENGIANISFDVDNRGVEGYYLDVFNPRNKKIFQCLGSNPENVSEEFKGKIKLSGDYKIGTIFFSVLNATEEDAGIYKSVIEMKGEEVGRQLLVLFDQFPTPKISTTKTANDREESGPTLTCHVETKGTPPGHPIPVSYKWKRNGHPVENSDKYGFQKSALIIKNLRRSDLTDHFTCFAENDYGAKSPESAALTISQYSKYQGSCVASCINGICEVAEGETKCKCANGWTGLNCSEDIDECSSNPCHSGTCYNNKYGEYLCICNPGWTGKQCELAINECQSSPCRKGTCQGLVSSYRCDCDDQWTGTNCETAINACSVRPCLHGRCEVMLNSSNDYDCVCNEGWSGRQCNIDAIFTASSKPSIIGGVGAGCASIIVALLIFGIWYRRHMTRVYMDTNMNSEDHYHDVMRIQSGDYCSIDDEQIYDIRRQIKSRVLVEARDANPDDDYPNLQIEGCTETVTDGIKTVADGYLNPAFSIRLNTVLESVNSPRNSQNSSKEQDTNQDDHSK